jgi:hypothetical protein
MRIIKHRAWDSIKCRWLFPHDLAICGDSQIIVNGGLPITVESFFRSYPHITIESFTNILDEHNKEVYEGDLLRVYSPDCQIQKVDIIYRVIWRCAQFELAVVKINQWEGFNVQPPEVGDVSYLVNILSSRLFKVIGNIHERL